MFDTFWNYLQEKIKKIKVKNKKYKKWFYTLWGVHKNIIFYLQSPGMFYVVRELLNFAFNQCHKNKINKNHFQKSLKRTRSVSNTDSTSLIWFFNIINISNNIKIYWFEFDSYTDLSKMDILSQITRLKISHFEKLVYIINKFWFLSYFFKFLF